MAQVRVRNKHQITIPARIAESANIKPDDMLEVAYNNGVVTLIPVSRKKRKESAMAYAGIARGIWGKTTFEIDTEQQNSRDSWER
jgi:AbrB family looped-hinge helix DNA binding protein